MKVNIPTVADILISVDNLECFRICGGDSALPALNAGQGFIKSEKDLPAMAIMIHSYMEVSSEPITPLTGDVNIVTGMASKKMWDKK
jgi:hypothetical protein